MPIDISKLYQEPYVDEINKIDNNYLSLQQFSLQLKSIVLKQQNKIHKKQFQALKDMKLSCLQLKQQLLSLKQHIHLYNDTAVLQESAQSNMEEINTLKQQIDKIQHEPNNAFVLINFALQLNNSEKLKSQPSSPDRLNDETKLNESKNTQNLTQSNNNDTSEYTQEQQFKFQYLLKQQFNDIQLAARAEEVVQLFKQSPVDIQESTLLHLYVLETMLTEYQGSLNIGGYLQNFVQQVTNQLIPLLFSQLKRQLHKRLLTMLQLFNPMKYKQIVLQVVAQASESVSQQLQQALNIYELVYNLYSSYQFYREYFINNFPHKHEIDVLFSNILSQEFKPKFNIMLSKLTFNESKENIFINQVLQFIDNYQKIQCILEFFHQIENKQFKKSQVVQNVEDQDLDLYTDIDKSYSTTLETISDNLINILDAYIEYKVPQCIQDSFLQLRPNLISKFRELESVSQEESLIKGMTGSITKQLLQKLFECSHTDYFYNIQIISQLLSYQEHDDHEGINILQKQYCEKLYQYTKSIEFGENMLISNDKMLNILTIYSCAPKLQEDDIFKNEVKQMLVRYLIHLSHLCIKNNQNIQSYQKEFQSLKQNNIITLDEASNIFEQVKKEQKTNQAQSNTQQE